MRVAFDPGHAVHSMLQQMSEAYFASRLRLRLIGGVAMLTHLEARGRVRGYLTQDFDTVIDEAACGTTAAAEELAASLERLREELGFVCSDPGPRLQGCRFRHREKPILFEQLCGQLPVGKVSDPNPPKWRIVRGRLYAGHLPALDWLAADAWTRVEASIGPGRASYEIPCLSGMYVLKVRAIRDKMLRVESDEPDSAGKEMDQLVKHARDLTLIHAMLCEEGRNELSACRTAREADEVRSTARRCHRGFFDRPFRDHERLDPLIGGSRAPLLDALEV